MDDAEVRALLSAYRAGECGEDARFQEALRRTQTDPELARWWAEEQELDRIIGVKLQSTEAPPDLKQRLLSQQETHAARRKNRSRLITLAIAAVVMLAAFFGSWNGPFQPSPSLADYRDEMVSFVKVEPTLELNSTQLSHITEWLRKSGAPSSFDIPPELRKLTPVGGRILRFRGHDVALICFHRSEGNLVHLFVIDRAALPRFSGKGSPQLSSGRKWTAAAWLADNKVYLLATEGDRALLERFLGVSRKAGVRHEGKYLACAARNASPAVQIAAANSTASLIRNGPSTEKVRGSHESFATFPDRLEISR